MTDTSISFVTQPNMYARGILFGKMKYELGDHAVVKCPETGLEADIEFKVKGWVSGTYNAIGGYIKETSSGKNLYELSGFWHGEMFIKNLATGKKELLFDAGHTKETPIKTRPIDQQTERESQRLWHKTTEAIKKSDHRGATDEKSSIEDTQRKEAAERGEGHVWQPKLFVPVPEGDEQKLDWIIHATVDADAPAEKQIEQILAIAPVLPDQKPASDSKNPAASHPNNGGDLIDFGQMDGSTSAVPSQPTATATAPSDSAKSKATTLPQMQAPLVPTPAAKPGPGNPISRTDSLGNPEEFVDAET